MYTACKIKEKQVGQGVNKDGCLKDYNYLVNAADGL